MKRSTSTAGPPRLARPGSPRQGPEPQIQSAAKPKDSPNLPPHRAALQLAELEVHTGRGGTYSLEKLEAELGELETLTLPTGYGRALFFLAGADVQPLDLGELGEGLTLRVRPLPPSWRGVLELLAPLPRWLATFTRRAA